MKRWIIVLVLFGCADQTGTAGYPCFPDGTCLSEHLACTWDDWFGHRCIVRAK